MMNEVQNTKNTKRESESESEDGWPEAHCFRIGVEWVKTANVGGGRPKTVASRA